MAVTMLMYMCSAQISERTSVEVPEPGVRECSLAVKVRRGRYQVRHIC